MGHIYTYEMQPIQIQEIQFDGTIPHLTSNEISAGSTPPFEKEMVNHPLHYQGKVEAIAYIEDKLTHEEFVGYLKGNVLKYMSRLGKKDKPVQDAKKAEWYLNRLISTYEAEGKNIAS